MDCDPLQDKLNQVCENIERLRQHLDHLRQELAWYESVNPTVLEFELTKLEENVQQLRSQCQSLGSEITRLESWQREIETSLASLNDQGRNSAIPVQLHTLQRIPQGVPEELASSLTLTEQTKWQQILAKEQSRHSIREDLLRVAEELNQVCQSLAETETQDVQLQERLGMLHTRQSSLKEAVNWYDSIRESDLSRQLADARAQSDRLSAACAALQAKIAQMRQELTGLKKQIGSPFTLLNPLNWLSSQVSQLRTRQRRLRVQLDRLESALGALFGELRIWQRRRQELERIMQRYQSFDRNAASAELICLQQDIARLTGEAQNTQRRLNGLKEAVTTKSAQHALLEAERNECERRIRELYLEILWGRQSLIQQVLANLRNTDARLASQLQQAETEAEHMRGQLEKYRNFDPDACRAELQQAEQKLKSLEQKKRRLEVLIRQRDSELAARSKVAKELKEKISKLEKDLRKARELVHRLESAPNGFYRLQIHKECETAFNCGNPQRVIANLRQKISGIKRKLERIRKAMVGKQERYNRMADVESLLIDGNNCCYERGDTFIGLQALRALIPVLLERGYRVLVVFDASICPMLGLSRAAVEEQFGNRDLVHIVPSRHSADETILALTNDDPHAFVLSNDHFTEYPESPAVQEHRIIRHEIVDGQMLVHSLAIQVRFREAGAG
jgi:chromosome segregation ATPase